MRRTGKRLLCLISCMLIALAFLTMGSAFAEGEGKAQLEKDVVVLFTSDVHCGVDQGFGYVGLMAVKNQFESEGCHLLLDHGNGFTMFEGGKVLVQSGDTDVDTVAAYIRDELKGVVGDSYESPYGQGRIVAVEEPDR